MRQDSATDTNTAVALRPLTCTCSPTSSSHHRLLQPSISRRTLFGGLFGQRKRNVNDPTLNQPSNPILDKYLKNKKPTPGPSQMTRGDLSSDSIFESARKTTRQETVAKKAAGEVERDPSIMAAVLDPAPRSRERWLRKMVIRQVRKGGRLTKTQALKQTEREHLTKSPDFPTSLKKLGPLARQIAGKPIEDAIVQMRFSRKKVAQDVRKHLEYARDEAIVKRGMGLGAVEGRKGEPVEIELKDGKRKLVADKTGIYVDQAWVGKGMHTISYDYRARGRVNLMKNPFTSISVLLKEEATRVRLSEEMQKKRDNRKVWVQLPDRPITAQRQHPCW